MVRYFAASQICRNTAFWCQDKLNERPTTSLSELCSADQLWQLCISFLPRFLLHSRNVWNELWWLCLTHYHCHRNLNCFILWMHFDQSLPIMMKMLQLFSFRNFWKRANLLLSCFPLSEVLKPTTCFFVDLIPLSLLTGPRICENCFSSIPHWRTFVCICCLQIFQQIIVAGSSNVSLCLTIRPRMSQCLLRPAALAHAHKCRGFRWISSRDTFPCSTFWGGCSGCCWTWSEHVKLTLSTHLWCELIKIISIATHVSRYKAFVHNWFQALLVRERPDRKQVVVSTELEPVVLLCSSEVQSAQLRPNSNQLTSTETQINSSETHSA